MAYTSVVSEGLIGGEVWQHYYYTQEGKPNMEALQDLDREWREAYGLAE